MKIKLDLPHEKCGGYTMAVFGEPAIRLQKKSGNLICIPCHIIIAGVEEDSPENYFRFQIIYPKLPVKVEKRMSSYARKLAEGFMKSTDRWMIKREEIKYTQKLNWCGFIFSLEPISNSSK